MKITAFLLLVLSALSSFAADTSSIKRWSPIPVKTGENNTVISLNGSWSFNPAPNMGFEKSTAIDASWKKIQVPGEWVMQGFEVKENQYAGYARSFSVSKSWDGKRIKLRCDAIYSESEIYIDGKKVGYHLGGFTPFEFDITKFVQPGKSSVIAIRVKNESLADSLASGSRYAVHPLGGITRKIQIVALPDVNLAMFHAATIFDKQYNNAILKAEIQLANERNISVNEASMLFELIDPAGKTVVSEKRTIKEAMPAYSLKTKTFDFPVPKPKKWDPEHPNLYLFRVTLNVNDRKETVERKIGFRQIDVRGNTLYVNNMPIKTRSVCRHEVSPLRGRSLTGDQWQKDVKIFREANVNFIRTSHYPPAEELAHACDSLGMMLEVEAPFCWANETKVAPSMHRTAIIEPTMAMVNQFKSHPSVIVWSLANESNGAYKRYFRKSGQLVKAFDPTRPRIFEQFGQEEDDGELELSNQHYPGPEGPSKYAGNKRPMSFGEYAHLNAYNRLELVTDPGIRDAWGIGFKNMWEEMYATPAILGGNIWAGIDDTFILPGGKVVGYGTWGPIDGWRRKKPEFWHVKKVFSPVKIKQNGNAEKGFIAFNIENRLQFSNINECRIQWRMGKYTGDLKADIPPGKTRTASINITGNLHPSDTMFVDVYDPRRVLIDQYAFTLLPEVVETIAQKKSNTLRYNRSSDQVEASFGTKKVGLNIKTGMLQIFERNKKVSDGALLMILPLNGEGRGIQMTGGSQDFSPFTAVCHSRIVKKVTYDTQRDKFSIKIYDEYDEARGFIEYEITGNGNVKTDYHYTLNKAVNPRQWGLVFTLPDEFNQLSWKRNGLWNYYPQEHIGRLSGTAKASSLAPISGPAGPVQQPSWPWSQDRNGLGTNDFRSTKMNILEASVASAENVMKIMSDGSQHVRTWKEQNQTKMLIAGYSNLGSERFFRSHAKLFDRPLKQGDEIGGTVHVNLR